MVIVKERGRENSRNLVRRFLKTIRRSGILTKARESRYYQRPKSEQLKKRAAIRRKELREKYRILKKMGKV